jgi:16S rRNA (cytidine1402-2'-O)-methyltransferase
MSNFYVIGTPIGNLGDITYRAIDTLKNVDVVVCEDTRVTQKLLGRYNIKKPLISFHARSNEAKIQKIVSLLKIGKNLAYVTDAGTPGISDPGCTLVNFIKKGAHNTEIIPIPGPSAFVAMLSVSGIPADRFIFLGFLPHKKGREKMLTETKLLKQTIVLYESPHRIIKTLKWMSDNYPDRGIAIGRELTKVHESLLCGTASEIYNHFKKNPDEVRGEFVVVVSHK